MSEPFIAEIVMFGGNFAPRGWALCDGQLLSISSNTALFSILGTTFGGDGRTTFGLPDLRGRVSMHPGNGPGLSSRRLGEKGGAETVQLNISQIPAHHHTFAPPCNVGAGNRDVPFNATPAEHGASSDAPYSNAVSATNNTMLGGDTSTVGANGAHNNIQPFQCVNYIIALVGVFPSRN